MGYGGGIGFGGGGGGGATPSPYLAVSDATILTRAGSTSTASDEADNTIRLSIPSGTPDGLAGSLDTSEIALMWDLGTTVEAGTLEHVIEWISGSIPDSCNIALFVGRGTLPTTLTELRDLDGIWLDMLCSAAPGVSTFLKNGSQSYNTGTSENKTDSEQISHAVSIDDAGMGYHMSRHQYTAGVQPRNTAHTKTPTSGNVVFSVLYHNNNAIGSDTDIDFKLRRSNDPIS